ncbi:Ferredoxin--NADP reductase [Castellaniella defragrans]
MDEVYDVAIAGGGPVGLFLAAELGMRGLSVALFDDKPEPAPILRRMPTARAPWSSFAGSG